MIKSEKVLRPLEEAENALVAGNHEASLSQAAVAFRISMREYEQRSQWSTPPGRGAYNVRDALTNFNWLSRTARDKAFGPGRENLEGIIENMGAVIGEAIMVVGYNLDFESYQLFKTFTPNVVFTGNEDVVVLGVAPRCSDPEIVRRCLNFAIDTAIRLEGRGR